MARADLFSVFADSFMSDVQRKGPSSLSLALLKSCVIVYKKERTEQKVYAKGIFLPCHKMKIQSNKLEWEMLLNIFRVMWKRNENAAVFVHFPKAQNNCFIGEKKSAAFLYLLIVDGCGLKKYFFLINTTRFTKQQTKNSGKYRKIISSDPVKLDYASFFVLWTKEEIREEKRWCNKKYIYVKRKKTTTKARVKPLRPVNW